MRVDIVEILDNSEEVASKYADTCLKYANISSKKLQEEEDIWHFRVESFYKEMNHLSQTLQALLDAMPSIFYIKDKNLKYVVANKAFQNTLGKNREVTGKTDFEILSRRKAQIKHYRDLEVIKEEKTLKIKDTIPLTQKNKIGIITKAPLYDENKLLIGVLCTITDITSLEEQKRENEELRIAIKNQTQRL